MSWSAPEKVLLTGGREVGGIASFAEGLASGFAELGVVSEIVPPSKLPSRVRELRDRRILKILSTTGMFAAPIARRTICMVHAAPLVVEQGWLKTGALLTCYKLANVCSAQLVSVSDYIAVHMRAFYGLHVNAVIRNPVKPIFLENDYVAGIERNYITYVGRLVSYKNIDRVLVAVLDLLNEAPSMRACIVGDGPERQHLQQVAAGHPRVEFLGQPSDEEVKRQLRRTKIFVSGHPTEGFGITYVEALSQGCIVAMPGSGGGIEIALSKVGETVQLLPITLDRHESLARLRRASTIPASRISIEPYSAKAVASDYLNLDRRFFTESPALARVPAPD